jgi:CheY-like chemotaxis protein
MDVPPKPRVVLVVEDDADHALLIKLGLSNTRAPLLVRAVSSGEQAIRYLSRGQPFVDPADSPLPSLILLDLGLPGISGFDVLEWLRAQAGLSRIPVVILTISAEPSDRRRAKELGATEYVVKPFDFSVLGPMVEGFLEAPSSSAKQGRVS